MFDFIEQKNNQIICKKKLRIVIDQSMFDDGMAEIIDDKVATIGILLFEVDNKQYRLSLPITIMINAENIYKADDNFYIDFEPNDIIIEKTLFVVSATLGAKNANSFLTMLTTAKITTDKPEKLSDIFRSNTSMNGLTLRVQSALVETMISELTRYSKDVSIPYRIALNNPKVQVGEFKMVNIKEISRLSSVFNAISFEDIKKSIEASVLMTRNKKDQNISPVEAVLKY